MKREDCWMTFSEALDSYMEARAAMGHFGDGANRRQAKEDLLTAKEHMDALTSKEPQCAYPTCVDNNEDERCVRWMTGECPGP